jgi:hypothetical protein
MSLFYHQSQVNHYPLFNYEDQELVEEFLSQRHDFDSPKFFHFDKSYGAVDRILKTRIGENSATWSLVESGVPLRDFHVGYGPLRILQPEDVQNFLQVLNQIAELKFRDRFNSAFYADATEDSLSQIEQVRYLQMEELTALHEAQRRLEREMERERIRQHRAQWRSSSQSTESQNANRVGSTAFSRSSFPKLPQDLARVEWVEGVVTLWSLFQQLKVYVHATVNAGDALLFWVD